MLYLYTVEVDLEREFLASVGGILREQEGAFAQRISVLGEYFLLPPPRQYARTWQSIHRKRVTPTLRLLPLL